MKNKLRRFDWFMLLLVVPFALFGSFVLWIGAKDIEEHKQEQRQQIDSVRQKIDAIKLETLEDSVHFYEDGL